MFDKNYILSVLRDEVADYSKKPRWGLPKGYFENRSYSNWAVEQLIHDIEISDEDPLTVAELFADRMNTFACGAGSHKTSVMFSTARDAALWILDILLALK